MMKRKLEIGLLLITSLMIPWYPSDRSAFAQIMGVPGGFLVAQSSKKQVRKRTQPTKRSTKPTSGSKTSSKSGAKLPAKSKVQAAPVANYERIAEKETNAEVNQEIQAALNLAKQGRTDEASRRLFAMSRSPKFADQRMQIRYYLGIVLYEMKLNQIAAFQFLGVVRDGNNRYVKQALERLSLAADKLGDDTMLNYALSKVKLTEFPKEHQDMLRFRIGEIQVKSRLYDEAVRTLSGVQPGSEWYAKAKYTQAMASVEKKDLNGAVKVFADLVESEASKGVNHVNRVTALMGLARVYYQQQQWDEAIDIYRLVPRDSELWHDVLFEMSWAQMRAAEFRNVLSNFHSLHSPFYEDFYIPESILLRSIVYLYICQYDEMEKTLELFERIYKPVLADLTRFLRAYKKPLTYYDEVAIQQDNFENLKRDRESRRKFQIPFLVARKIMQEGDYSRIRSYITQIRTEQKTIDGLGAAWKGSDLGQYAQKILKGRLSGARKAAGGYVRAHVEFIRQELAQLFEQHGFARYEMLNGRKEQIKKRMAGKALQRQQVDEDAARDYYIQNGFEYWPFQGEYWLDEIGNYHYLGTQSCE